MSDAAANPFTPEEQHALRKKIVEEKLASELYLRQHPEIARAVSELVNQVLKRRPADPVAFAQEYFANTDLHAVDAKLVAESGLAYEKTHNK